MGTQNELRSGVDALPGLVWPALPDGHIDFLNQRWCKYTGLSLEQACGWGWQTAIHPQDLPELLKCWRSILASGEPGEMEARLWRFDGEYRWLLVSSSPLRDAAGKIIKWIGVSNDIDDRRRAEEALHARELSFRLIVDSIPAPVAIMTPAGELEGVNQPALEYFGKAFKDLKGWTTSDAVHPDDLPQVVTVWREAVETGCPYEVEHRLRRFDGLYRWFHLHGFPLRDNEWRILKWCVLLTDIDDRKNAEEALRESELNLRQMTESIPEMLWSATPEGAIDYCNARLLDYTGFPAEVIMGNGWTKLLHPDDIDQAARMWTSCVTSGAPYRVEVRTFHAADRTYRWCVTNARPLLDQQEHILKWHGRVVDMHDWKEAQEELRNTQGELAHMARVTTMGELTASIAHEVNQPLSGIITNASTCLRMLAADPPNVDGARETARRTIRDGNRASDVITRLRALFSKKEPTTELVDLNEATREVIALSLSKLQRSQVILRPEFADDLPLVTGDRVQLQQVVLNLLRNALEAMSNVDDRPRQLVIRTELDEGDCVRLTVQDAGVGFDPQAVDRLFKAFYTTKNDGMGMGLSVSRSIIESHHGRLWAAPNDGPGATFSFSIPRGPEDVTGVRSLTAIRTHAAKDAQRVARNP
jgi:PAS domain S-box-containing protein